MGSVAGVHNIFNNQYVAALNINAKIDIVPYFSTFSAAIVRGQLGKSYFAGDIYLFYQVDNKQETAIQYPNEYRHYVLVIFVKLQSYSFYTFTYSFSFYKGLKC